MDQYDIFGCIVHFEKPSRKTKTMHELFGLMPDKKCKTCKHLYARRQSRTWYKCEIWDDYFRGCSEASDIRLKQAACGKYEEKEAKK